MCTQSAESAHHLNEVSGGAIVKKLLVQGQKHDLKKDFFAWKTMEQWCVGAQNDLS